MSDISVSSQSITTRRQELGPVTWTFSDTESEGDPNTNERSLSLTQYISNTSQPSAFALHRRPGDMKM